MKQASDIFKDSPDGSELQGFSEAKTRELVDVLLEAIQNNSPAWQECTKAMGEAVGHPNYCDIINDLCDMDLEPNKEG